MITIKSMYKHHCSILCHTFVVSATLRCDKYLVALMIVIENMTIRTKPMTETMVISIGGVLIIRNSSICSENPILKSTPNKTPLHIETIKRIII